MTENRKTEKREKRKRGQPGPPHLPQPTSRPSPARVLSSSSPRFKAARWRRQSALTPHRRRERRLEAPLPPSHATQRPSPPSTFLPSLHSPCTSLLHQF